MELGTKTAKKVIMNGSMTLAFWLFTRKTLHLTVGGAALWSIDI